MPALSFAQFEAIVTIADYGSFTAAADVLGIAQPSLSRRVHSMEDSLGLSLFVPAGRQMILTEAGRNAVAAGRRALVERESIEAMAESAQSLATGSLRLTGLPSLVATMMSGLVGEFHRVFPGVRIEISTVEDSAALVEALRLGQADAAIGVTEMFPADLLSVPLTGQTFAAVLPPESRAEDQVGSLTHDELLTHTLVTLPQGTSIRTITDNVYRAYGAQPPRVITTTQREALVHLSISAGGITIVPENLAHSGIASRAHVAKLRTPVERPVGILYREAPFPNPALSGFLKLATQAA